MPGKIYLEAKPVLFGEYHSYLIYENENNELFTIRGGPQHDTGPAFGDIEMEINLPLEESEDCYKIGQTSENRFRKEIDLNGRDASEVWQKMSEHAEKIHESGIDYNAYFDASNCNSVTASILKEVGIDFEKQMPLENEKNENINPENFVGHKNQLKININPNIQFEDPKLPSSKNPICKEQQEPQNEQPQPNTPSLPGQPHASLNRPMTEEELLDAELDEMLAEYGLEIDEEDDVPSVTKKGIELC